MSINLRDYQIDSINKLKSGSILCGGVGSGKSRTSIAYYFLKECEGNIKINGKGDVSLMKKPKDLYIITTAKKRDSLEWEGECSPFSLSTNQKVSINGVKVVIDSWNNLPKYINTKNSFFIFDEQRLVGSGAWVKSFLKIAKSNKWILLSATPGDTWLDYIPVFIANGFYKNRTDFLRKHAVYSRFTNFPKIDKFIEVPRLIKLKNSITVIMDYKRSVKTKDIIEIVPYDKKTYDMVMKKRWDPYSNEPIKNISMLCYIMRKVINSDCSRLEIVEDIIKKHPKVIIFYNFDYELVMLKNLGFMLNMETKEWNGHKHDEVPKGKEWIYLVQYTAGAEGWNCITTDTIIFFSQNYSYKIMTQAAGRIDRLNTPYSTLNYYHIKTKASIDLAIDKTLKNKKDFNANKFINSIP